ncbi:MAG: ZIP family metal transporter [Acidobacteriota bacterium]
MKTLNPLILALIATGFTWTVTAIGASLVFFIKQPNRKILDSMLGFAAGVMIAASYWSLLAPSLEMSKGKGAFVWFPAATGFLIGSLFIWLIDKFLPHLHLGFPVENAEGIRTHFHQSTLLFLAVTLHNIPEGLAVGVAFGALASDIPSATLAGAVALAIGIGIQNFPEGIAISMPLRSGGVSRFKSFWYGQLSAIVEPIAGLIGALSVTVFHSILPYAMAFAAGAMIYVVIEEIIPESQRAENTDLATFSALVGFVSMMILDVAFG